MRILVLGAGGMAGHTLTIRLAELGHQVTGLARKKLHFCDCIELDVRDEAKLREILLTEQFDAVVNAVGALQRTVADEPARGIWTNSYFPHLLADMTAATSTRVIHLSTDCVFDGHDNGGYLEADAPNAVDDYGRSKALGELNDSKNLTLRMSIVGPDINQNGTGLFNWFMHQHGEINGYAKAIWTGVSTTTLGDAIHAALNQNLTGLYHLVNNDSINKYELLNLFNELRMEPVHIRKTEDYTVDKSLKSTRSDFNFAVPSYREMILEMGRWINRHKELYPDYDVKECL